MRWRHLQFAMLTFLLCAAASAEPPQLVTIGELARRADIVFVGDTADVTSAWNPSHTMIFTTVRQRVVDGMLFKGSAPGGQVTWRQPGGQVDNILTIVHDGPRFVVGERSLLFLLDPGRMGLVPTVLGQLGKIPVATNEQQQPVVVLWRLDRELYPAPPSPRAERVVLSIYELKSIFGVQEVR